jgi:hypothetical protein
MLPPVHRAFAPPLQNRRIRRFSTNPTTLYQALTQIKIGGSPIFANFSQRPISAFSGKATAGFSFPTLIQTHSL